MQPSSAPSIKSSGRARLASRLGLAIVLLALGIVSIDFLLTVYGKYHKLDPAAYTMYWSRRAWLWTHLAGGALTILLGLAQFMTRWPRDYPNLHRYTGRTYMACMLVACVGAMGLLASSLAPFSIRAAFAATALAWLTTALVGLIEIRAGRLHFHRRWMVRHYLVTLSPIVFRALLEAPVLRELMPPPASIPVLLWLSWLAPLLICEAVYRIHDRVASRRLKFFNPDPFRSPA